MARKCQPNLRLAILTTLIKAAGGSINKLLSQILQFAVTIKLWVLQIKSTSLKYVLNKLQKGVLGITETYNIQLDR